MHVLQEAFCSDPSQNIGACSSRSSIAYQSPIISRMKSLVPFSLPSSNNYELFYFIEGFGGHSRDTTDVFCPSITASIHNRNTELHYEFTNNGINNIRFYWMSIGFIFFSRTEITKKYPNINIIVDNFEFSLANQDYVSTYIQDRNTFFGLPSYSYLNSDGTGVFNY